MIPLDAIDKLLWQSKDNFYMLNVQAKYWYKKRELKKERAFQFGMNDIKIVKEFESALHFLIFKMKQDIFSEN